MRARRRQDSTVIWVYNKWPFSSDYGDIFSFKNRHQDREKNAFYAEKRGQTGGAGIVLLKQRGPTFKNALFVLQGCDLLFSTVLRLINV